MSASSIYDALCFNKALLLTCISVLCTYNCALIQCMHMTACVMAHKCALHIRLHPDSMHAHDGMCDGIIRACDAKLFHHRHRGCQSLRHMPSQVCNRCSFCSGRSGHQAKAFSAQFHLVWFHASVQEAGILGKKKQVITLWYVLMVMYAPSCIMSTRHCKKAQDCTASPANAFLCLLW